MSSDNDYNNFDLLLHEIEEVNHGFGMTSQQIDDLLGGYQRSSRVALIRTLHLALDDGLLIQHKGVIAITDIVTPYLNSASINFEPLGDYIDRLLSIDSEIETEHNFESTFGCSTRLTRNIRRLVKIGWLEANERMYIRLDPELATPHPTESGIHYAITI
jgi:hypothetical protein